MRHRTVLMIVIWVLSGFVIIGLVAAGLSYWGFTFGHSSSSAGPSGNDVEYLRESYPLSEIDTLSVDVSIAEVSLHYSDTDEIVVTQFGSDNLPDSMLVTASQRGSSLTVQTPKLNFSFPTGVNHRNSVEIALPQGYNGDLTLRLSTGDMEMRDSWSLHNMDLSLSLGSLTARDALSADLAKISVSTGSLALESITSDNLTVDCSLGDVEIQSLTGAGKVSNSTGSVKLLHTELTGDLKVTNSLGDVKIALAPDQSVDFSGSTNLGSLKTFFAGNADGLNNKLSATLGGGEHKLEVSNSTGDVAITEA